MGGGEEQAETDLWGMSSLQTTVDLSFSNCYWTRSLLRSILWSLSILSLNCHLTFHNMHVLTPHLVSDPSGPAPWRPLDTLEQSSAGRGERLTERRFKGARVNKSSKHLLLWLLQRSAVLCTLIGAWRRLKQCSWGGGADGSFTHFSTNWWASENGLYALIVFWMLKLQIST